METKRIHLTGHRSALKKVFELTREIPLVLSSWPYEADPLKGYVVQLSPTLNSAETFLEAIAQKCGVQCRPYVEADKNMYGIALEEWRRSRSFGFTPPRLSEFAAGYCAALNNVKEYGLERVQANAASGIPK